MPRYQKRPEHNQMDEIVQFRISSKDKEDLMQAAAISGLKYTTYARQHLMSDVHKDLKAESENSYILNDEDWNLFLEILEAPTAVPGKLKSAQAKFKKKYSK